MTPDEYLFEAAKDGYTTIVQGALTAGADVNAKTAVGVTPLHYAAAYGHTAVAELLIENGADVRGKGATHRIPMQLARFEGHTKMIALLKAAAQKQGKRLTDRVRRKGELGLPGH